MFSDDQNIGGQLKVGIGIVPAIGEGPLKINGSMYSEGPAVFGVANLRSFFAVDVIFWNQIE